jgi:Fe-S oxidoreductase
MDASDIMQRCSECQLCVYECFFLSNLRKTPKKVVEELAKKLDPVKSYIMECFLCGLCQAVCPLNLDFPSVIAHARLEQASFVLNDRRYKLFLPDEPMFFPRAYKTYKNLNYDSSEKNSFVYAFLPGCSMSCYSPEATLKVYEKLEEKLDAGLVDLCCGKPLSDAGLAERALKWLVRLESYLKSKGCEKIITACPKCYYHLQSMFQGRFEVLTVYEVLGELLKEGLDSFNSKIAIHDSCPDRFKGHFATHVRKLFNNEQVLEMSHSRNRTICCGSGGMVSCFNPYLSAMASSRRVMEFLEAGADLMVVYCYTCAQIFWVTMPKIETKHVLDIALKTHDASQDVKNQEVSKIAMKLLMGEP